MALSTAPTSIAALRGSARRMDRRTEVLDLRAELQAHDAEAQALVAALAPHLSALHRMATELGPVALRHVLSVSAHLSSYARRHEGDDAGEIAA